MKAIKCYECDIVFKSETRDDILNQLYSHYMEKHHAIITGASEQVKKDWMQRFQNDWLQAVNQ